MKKIQSTLVAAVLSMGGITAANAAQVPNFYECTGKNVSLSLVVGSNAEVGIMPPQTMFNLKMGQKSYSFQTEQIGTESTLIGDLWEVTLNAIPDLYTEHASVVIPSISLGDSPLRFKSRLILTRVETPFSPAPLEGVINPSKYIDISCTASILFY